MIYPWTHSQWHSLMQRAADDHLPHALIFSGLDGLGKLKTATAFAQFLLCDSPVHDLGCNQCRSCVQFNATTHPDFTLIEPEETGKQIKIDQIRGLVNSFSLARHYNSYRIAIISPADAMNQSSANSLLKSLEEPPEHTLIILVTAKLSVIPATIKSRCQQIKFAPPGHDMALTWLNNQQIENEYNVNTLLAVANGAPLKALNYVNSEQLKLREMMFTLFYTIGSGKQSPLSVENQQLKHGITEPIQHLYSWISDLIKMKLQRTQSITNADKLDQLQKLSSKVELERLFLYLDQIIVALRLQQAPLNSQMVMDELMLEWQQISSV